MGKSKIMYLEVMRVVCAIAVLFDHVPVTALHYYDADVSLFNRFLCCGVVDVSRFAVPVFVMITGYLLLQPSREIDFKKAVTKYAWRMGVVLAVVGTTFSWMEIFFNERTFTLMQIPTAFCNMLQGNTWDHMWYLYMLIGLYLVTPVLKVIVNNMTQRSVDYFTLILLCFTSVFPLLDRLGLFSIGVKFPITSEYVALMFIGYRLAGMEMNEETKRKVNVWAIVLSIGLAIMFFSFAYIYTMNVDLKWLKEFNHYSSPFVFLFSASIFVWAMTSVCEFKVFKRMGGAILSRDSFGIYVFHQLWINVIYKLLKFNPWDYGFWSVMVVLLAVLLLAWATTIIFRKIPVIGKFI